MWYGSIIPSARKASVQSSNALGKDLIQSLRELMTWCTGFSYELQQSLKLFTETDYGCTVVMILHRGFKNPNVRLTRLSWIIVNNPLRITQNGPQKTMTNNSLRIMHNKPQMVMSNKPRMVMNNNPYLSGEADDQDNLQIDFNPCELSKEGRNVTVELYSILIRPASQLSVQVM